MKLLVAAMICLMLISLQANSQTFKVLKIQGKKAIVEVSDPALISTNESYEVGSGSSHTASGSPVLFKRDYGIAASFSMINQSSPSFTVTTLGGTFLWNMKTYEVGPTARIEMTSSGSLNSTTSTFGGTGFYNFTENKVGVEGIPSAVGTITMSSGGGSSSTNISFGGNYRWFLLSGDHCISMSALYRQTQASGSSVSGFALEGGIATYF